MLVLQSKLVCALEVTPGVSAHVGSTTEGSSPTALIRLICNGACRHISIVFSRAQRPPNCRLPAWFELTVNLKTAKALGLNISDSFLLRADATIE